MKRRHRLITFFSLFIIQFSFGVAQAEPIIQSFTLNPGWNAIFLEVEPVWFDLATETAHPDNNPTDPEIVFAGVPELISVWMWNPSSDTMEYIQNPSVLVPEAPQMLAYLPLEDPVINNLHAIHGNYAYLVNLGGAVPATLTVRGEPLPPKISWKPGSFNFVGFHLDAGQSPSFTDFFSSSAAHEGQEMYVLDNATGTWTLVFPTDLMQKGEGFWVYCNGSSEFQGPVSVQLNQGRELDYGISLDQQEITVKNNSASPQTISVSLTDVGALPGSVSSYPLFYWQIDPATNLGAWQQFPTYPSTQDLEIGQGESTILHLGVKRAGLGAGVTYRANLEINDGGFSSFKVPVSTSGISWAGLWVGEASIKKVNQPASETDPNTPTPVGAPMNYRLILHVDEAGQVNLLNQVIQMLDKPSGTFVLLTDDALIPFFSGSALRDGQPVSRRMSAPSFGNFYDDDDITRITHKPMDGNFTGQDNTLLEVALLLPKDDPTNPFVHRYHPSHGAPNVSTPPERVFEIRRNISMTFSGLDSDGSPIDGQRGLGWGSSNLGGVYREKICGVMGTCTGQPADYNLILEGDFELRKVSGTATLTISAD